MSELLQSSLKPRKFRIKISAFALAIILTTAGVLLTSACVATITSVFSEDAAKKMAKQISNIMMEKTSYRIKSILDRAHGIAASAQAGVRIAENVPMPYQDPAGPTSWFRKWQVWGAMFEKALHRQVHGITFFFDDGSHVSIGSIPYKIGGVSQQVLMVTSQLGTNSPPTPPGQPLPWTTSSVTMYNHSQMQTLLHMTMQVQIEGTRRVGYDNTLPPFSLTYSTAMSMMPTSIIPTIKISYSLFNASNIFLGIGEVMVSLKIFESLVGSQRPTAHTEVIILDRYRNVVASSIANTPLGSNLTVPLSYNLTETDEQNGCGLAASMMNLTGTDSDAEPGIAPAENTQYLVCLKNSQNLGYDPLKVMQQKGLIPSKDDIKISLDVKREKLGDLGYYYIAIDDYNQYFPGLDWIAVVLIPEDEILDDIVQGRNIAIGVCVGLAVFIAIGNGFLMRLFLRPLAEIVFQMQSAAYLHEESASTPSGSSGESVSSRNTNKEAKKKMSKASDAAAQLNLNRTPSYLTDVAAIQHAYWGMVDELGLLRGYIPEHLRDQLLENHRRANNRRQMNKNSDSSDMLEMVEVKSPDGDLDGPFTSLDNEQNGDEYLVVADREDEVGEALVPSGFSIHGSPVENQHDFAVSTSTGHNPTASSASNKKSAPQLSEDSNTRGQKSKTSTDSHAPPVTSSLSSLNRDPAQDRTHPTDSSLMMSTTEMEIMDFKDPIPPYNLPPISEKASTRQAARFASLGNLTDNNDPKALLHTFDPLPLFAENGLVERNITVALINITGFHHYVFTTGTGKVVKEHEQFVSYVHEVAKRCGGVLDNFNGDKFWVSFNASTPCDEIYVAATLFAHEVATTVNGDAVSYQYYLKCSQQRSEKLPPLSPQRPRFPVALRGVTIGVATGRAFVGPLGTKKIRRHTITSNAISEASALERMAARYPDCGVMVGGDMIPAIEGYFQFMLLDATTLPGSGGLRRRIASIKGLMAALSDKRPKLGPGLQLSPRNPFDPMNGCFNAFMEGRNAEVAQMMNEIANQVELSRQEHASKNPNLEQLPDGRPVLTPLECHNIALMLQFMVSLGRDADGRLYRSPLGDLFERNTQ